MHLKWIKPLVSLLLFAVLLYFFWPLLAEIKAAGYLLQQASWLWLPVALFFQLVSYLFLTWLNILALQPFSGRIGFWQLARLLTAMAFIQVAIPSAGASGAALRVRLLGKFGYKSEESLFSLAVETMAEIIAIITIAIFGLSYLFSASILSTGDLTWMLVVGLATLACLWLVWRLLSDRAGSLRVLDLFTRAWNRLLGRFWRIDSSAAASRLETFQANLRNYRQAPLWKFCLAAYGKVFLDIATLWAGFFLVGYALSVDKLVLGYSLILTASGLAILPGGLGMTDAYVPVIFSWLNTPGSVALVAGLVYRMISYWLLRFIGFINWLVIEARY